MYFDGGQNTIICRSADVNVQVYIEDTNPIPRISRSRSGCQNVKTICGGGKISPAVNRKSVFCLLVPYLVILWLCSTSWLVNEFLKVDRKSVICLLIFTDRVTEHVFILGENFKYNVLVWHAQTNFCRSPHSLDSWKATSGFVYMSSCDRTQGCSQIPQRPCHSRGFDTNWSAVNKTWCVGRVGYKKDIKKPCPSNR